MNQQLATYLAANHDRHLAELFDFLRVPSVSALPAHQQDMVRAANWVVERLKIIGVPEVMALETGGHPLVWGRWQVDPAQPTVLIYAHYDVQPPDPLDLWQSPPFEPEVRDGKIYARGAGDDKGGLFATIMMLEALCAVHGQPPVNLVFFFEGEEEIGSPNVAPAVNAWPERFACDYVLSADGMMWSDDHLSLTVATKGMAKCQVDLRTAAQDTHSGLYGATIRNAAQAMAMLAASFHTADGTVAVKGFYGGVRLPTRVEQDEIEAAPFDEPAFLAAVGASIPYGEPGYSTLERAWLRPTLDFNGMWSGFQGVGSKTVTPSEAHLKITCRLVPGQDPAEILDLIKAHVARHTPPGAAATVVETGGHSRPFAVDRSDTALLAAADVLRELAGVEPVVIRLGGTLPIAEVFQQKLGADMVFFAWSLPECNAHAPNEWYRVEDLQSAAIATGALLQKLKR